METNETQKANKGIVTNTTIVMGIVGLVCAIPNRPLETIPTILFSCAALLFIFFPVFMLIERIKIKGVRVGNWTVYRLYSIHFKISVACFTLVSILLLTVIINQIYLLHKLV